MVEKKPDLWSNSPVEAKVFIGLGSNEGDRELHLLRVVAELGKLPATRITALSPFYDTEPVGDVPQANFLNAVARLVTTLTPHQLLSQFQRIESHVFMRKRTIPGGSRPMDIDMLLYEDLILADADLTLPHPRTHERRFVLQPLADIAPDLIHPALNRTVAQLLAALPPGPAVTRI